ncbi:hypothetical protein TNCV_5021881 [Trichonephila clavipes]|nr:hypothetical protein TNCV_5021881 [Trichonephila clavipes]
MLRHYMKDRGLVMGQVDRTQENLKDVGKPRKGAGKKKVDNMTRITTRGTNRAAERRPVRSKQATAVRPCPYYLQSRVKQPEVIP